MNSQKQKIRWNGVAHLVFPFGCSNSQFKAVKNALENSFSIIQGPPGSGKTQTILNIIANLLILNKTVLVVSNNKPAIKNVHEKLSSQKHNLGFIVASLGKSENMNDSLQNQSGEQARPPFRAQRMSLSWATKSSPKCRKNRVKQICNRT